MQKNLKRIAILLAVVVITLLVSLSVSNDNPLPTKAGFMTDQPKSAIGSYLAGQHAARKNDYGTASKYFLDSLRNNENSKNTDSALDENVLNLLIATGDYEEALKLSKKMSVADDAENSKLMVYADAVKNNDFAAAKEILNSLQIALRENVLNSLLRAWAEVGLDNNIEATKIVFGLSKESYFASIIIFNQALIAEIAGENDLASKSYKTLLESNHPTKTIAQNAYRFFKDSGDNESAKILFALSSDQIDLKKLSEKPTARVASSEVFNDIAGAYLLQQNFAKASMYYRLGLYIEPGNEDIILLLGAILAHERDFDAANELFKSIPVESENYSKARIAQTQNYIGMENTVAAKKLLKELAENAETKIEASVSLGDLARQSENFQESNEYYSDAIDASVDKKNQQVYWPIYFARGVTFERLNLWEAAEADFKKALELKPKQADVLNYLAYSLLDMNFEARFDEALNMLEIAYDQRPNDPHIIDSIGWAWFKKGDYAKATKHLERAASEMPYDPTINEHLGDVYWKSGREKEAVFAWKRALENKPEERFIEQLKLKIENGLDAVEPNTEQAEEGIELETEQENIDPSAS